jgi:hypothetical protein
MTYFKGAGKKGGLSENQDIENGYIGNRCISDTSDDVISVMLCYVKTSVCHLVFLERYF